MSETKVRLAGPRTGPTSEGAGATRFVYPLNNSEAFDNRIDSVAKRAVDDMDRFVKDASDLLVHGIKPSAG